jgi:hypothetical protein
MQLARDRGRPLLHIDLAAHDDDAAAAALRAWLDRCRIAVMNVAGTRESGCPGLRADVHRILLGALSKTAR